MENLYDNAARDFLELASEQRLNILFNLMSHKSKISPMAKELGSTVQEVHRNFERLANAGLIKKDGDGYYQLTTYGRTICTQVPNLVCEAHLESMKCIVRILEHFGRSNRSSDNGSLNTRI